MIPIAILTLFSLLFLVALIFSVKTWRWFHVMMVFFVYVAAIFSVIYTAMSLKTRTTWIKVATAQQERLETLTQQVELIEHGGYDEVRPSSPTVKTAINKLERILTYRGRVWRQSKPTIANNQITITTVANPNKIEMGAILYAFKEWEYTSPNANDVGGNPPAQIFVPSAYVGEFTATNVTANTVTIRPTIPLNLIQTAHVRFDSTWALYEVMPVDGHRLFSHQDVNEQKLDDTEKPLFGEMREQDLGEAFRDTIKWTSSVLPQPPNDAAVKILAEKLYKNYLRDGLRSERTEDPANVWKKVRFKKKVSVEVDSKEAQVNFSANVFDATGNAISTTLRRGEPVEFDPNDIAVFHVDKADELVEKGDAEEISPIYVRPLHDYAYKFHELFVMGVRTSVDAANVVKITNKHKESEARLDALLAYRKQDEDKLKVDKGNFERDEKVINDYRVSLQKQHQESLDNLSRLHALNSRLARELDARTTRQAEQIDQQIGEGE